MNCCDAWGDCQQSDTCPARTGVVLPHQAAHAARVARIKASKPRTCDELGVCQGKGDCACTHPVPSEAGNFKIVDLGPDDATDQPLTHDENMQVVRTLLFWLLAVLGTVGGAAFGVGYVTEVHGPAIAAFLQGVL